MGTGESRGEPGGMGEAQGRGEGDRFMKEGDGVLVGDCLGEVAGVDRGDSSSMS